MRGVRGALAARRIGIHPESRRLRVKVDGHVVADTQRALVLTEGRLPTRWYIPREDVSAELEPSDRRTACPFKGRAVHFSVGSEEAVAWSYEDPLDEVSAIRDLVAFYNERVEIDIG